MFYGSFGTQNQMMAFVFKFGLRKGQCQVKIGQNRSNFQMHYFITKTCLSCLVYYFSGFQRCYMFFAYDNYKCQKLRFQKVTTSPLPVFCYHCTAKSKDFTLKFGVRVVCMQLNGIDSGFKTCQNLNLLDINSGKTFFWSKSISAPKSENDVLQRV